MEFPLYAVVLVTVVVISSDLTSGIIKLGPGTGKLSEDGKMNFTQISIKYGYPAEEIDLYTKDDYILSLFHIPGDKQYPVLLVHGNTPTADCWISRGKTSMALTLAEAGCDVWAINLRGSRYGRRHRYLDPDKQPERFFNFSFYEQGVLDLPAAIDLILERTGQEKLVVISHSVGTTNLFVLGSEMPEYNDKIKIGVALAPIIFLQNLGGSNAFTRYYAPPLLGAASLLNIREVVRYEDVATISHPICLGPLGYAICIQVILSGALGRDEESLEPEFLPTLIGHYPGGASTKTYRHLTQGILKDTFAHYDYGKKENLMLYNSTKPPNFDLSKVTMPNAIFLGLEDLLSSVPDGERLRDSLPNVVHFQIMPYRKFNHIDFIWGNNMTGNFYPYLFKLLKPYLPVKKVADVR